jgi:hypothetical protein
MVTLFGKKCKYEVDQEKGVDFFHPFKKASGH